MQVSFSRSMGCGWGGTLIRHFVYLCFGVEGVPLFSPREQGPSWCGTVMFVMGFWYTLFAVFEVGKGCFEVS